MHEFPFVSSQLSDDLFANGCGSYHHIAYVACNQLGRSECLILWSTNHKLKYEQSRFNFHPADPDCRNRSNLPHDKDC